jgi:hypothetical protein
MLLRVKGGGKEEARQADNLDQLQPISISAAQFLCYFDNAILNIP